MVFRWLTAALSTALLAGNSCGSGNRAVQVEPRLSPEHLAGSRLPPSVLITSGSQDGTPDFLRLDSESDRATFRRWFCFLAEVQYFNSPNKRPLELVDCSSLLRYCYREALRLHDTRWSEEARLPLVPAFGSVRKYNYPRRGMNGNLFRTRAGPLMPSDLSNGGFSQFANAEALMRFNTFPVSRSLRAAEPGDLLFFKRRLGEGRSSYHSMIFLGPSQIRPSATQFVVYDTGPDGARSGEIRLLAVQDLLDFPDPAWRPFSTNQQFLGVFRWNVLHDAT